MSYIEGFVVAVPTKNKGAYQKHAQEAWPYFKKLGAVRMVEAWGDDVPEGKVTDFKRAVQARPDEQVVFSWIEYPDRATRDAANQKMMAADSGMPSGATPFDAHRMIFGGFAPLLVEGNGKGGYVDGVIVPVPNGKKEQYRAFAKATAALFREHGALSVVETWGDDIPKGKDTDFFRSIQASDGENVVFSWIVWPDKTTRDQAWQACMKDPRMQTDSTSIFDDKRMFWGGFTPIVDA